MSISPVSATAEEEQALREFGKYIMTLPEAPLSGSALQKAQYGYEKYCDALAKVRAGVNNDAQDRVFFTLNSVLRWSDRTFLACDEHTKNLEDILTGMGLNNKAAICTEKLESVIWDVNRNHGALVFTDDDGNLYVFDAWMHATVQEEEFQNALEQISQREIPDYQKVAEMMLARERHILYSGAKTNLFNGMPLKDWIEFCKARGYEKFSDESDNFVHFHTGSIIDLFKLHHPASIKNQQSFDFTYELINTGNNAYQVNYKVIDSDISHDNYGWAVCNAESCISGFKQGQFGGIPQPLLSGDKAIVKIYKLGNNKYEGDWGKGDPEYPSISFDYEILASAKKVIQA